MRIFVVEDDPAVSTVLRRFLEGRGHEVLTFTHPAAALEAARRQPLHILITDFDLPGMSGLELIEAMGGSVSERVILISGNPGAVDRALIGKLGIHTFLVKPFHLDEIAQAIKGTQG